jgi:hypothetical protein
MRRIMVKKENRFFNAINDTLFKYTDDSDKNYSLILGDFNCADIMITKWEMINTSTKHLTAYGVTT